MDTYKIGDFAKITGLKIDTVRYYESQGILNESKRDSNGYRIFTIEDIKRITFVKKCKEFGFTLKEIKWMAKQKIDKLIIEKHANYMEFTTEQLAYLHEIVRKKVIDLDEEIETIRRKKNEMLSYFDAISKGLPQGDNFCPLKK